MSKAKVEEWMAKAPERTRGLIEVCRALILGIDPAITEGIKWRNLFFQWEGENLGAVVPYKDHVNLQFWKAVFLDDPEGRLEGTGKEARHLKIRDESDIDAEFVTRLMGDTIALYQREKG